MYFLYQVFKKIEKLKKTKKRPKLNDAGRIKNTIYNLTIRNLD